MSKSIRLIHFNDVYEIKERNTEPVGGASRFATELNRLRDEKPSLLFFSGDCFSPSVLSVITKGSHMVRVLNQLKVDAAVVGNHDLDFGEGVLAKHVANSTCSWLLSNVDSFATKEPLATCMRYTILESEGVRVGVIGLVEEGVCVFFFFVFDFLIFNCFCY